MNVITIDRANFLQGFSLSDYSGDKGFAWSQGVQVNKQYAEGLLYPGLSGTEYNTNLEGNIVAITPYLTGGAYYYFMLDASGNIYQTAVVTVAHTKKATDGDRTYDSNSSLLMYGGNLYGSSQTNIFKSDLSFTGGDPDWDWWKEVAGGEYLTAGVPHKLIEYQGTMFCTNGNKIVSWTGSAHNDSAFSLPTGWIITDIEIFNNKLYISASYLADNNNYSLSTKIFAWDTINPAKWDEEMQFTNHVIKAMKSFNGSLYLLTKYGFFKTNGYSYTKMSNLDFYGNFNQVTTWGNSIYFVSNKSVACYDTILNSFSIPYYANVTYGPIFVGYAGAIDITYSTNKFSRLNANASNGVFYSNLYTFAQPIMIRKVKVTFKDAMTTGQSFTASLYDESATLLKEQTISYAVHGGKKIVEYPVQLNTDGFKFTFSLAANAIISFKIYYDVSERSGTK